MRKQAGFTIIELVVVIILLGILAATALPRFIDVTDDAHTAAFEGVHGGFQTGVSMYHAQWVADGQPLKDTQISEFGNLRTNDVGYPYGTADNSAGTSEITTDADCGTVFQNVLQGGAPSLSVVAAAANVVGVATDFAVHENSADCLFYYTAKSSVSGASIPTLAYDSTNGTVTAGTATLP